MLVIRNSNENIIAIGVKSTSSSGDIDYEKLES